MKESKTSSRKSRRAFISASVAVTTASLLNISPANANKQKGVSHQVYFWLKNPGSAEDRAQLIKGVKTLQKIEVVRKLVVGVVAATQKRAAVDDSWGVSALTFFDDVAGEAAYQIDPIHTDFVKNYSHLWSKVVVYDSSEV
jgi:hypothetical protein